MMSVNPTREPLTELSVAGILKALGRPISYYPALALKLDSINASVFLCQLLYWSTRTSDPQGWVYKTADDWQHEIGLTYREQRHARGILRQHRVIEERLEPGQRVYFRIIGSALNQLVLGWEAPEAGDNLSSPPTYPLPSPLTKRQGTPDEMSGACEEMSGVPLTKRKGTPDVSSPLIKEAETTQRLHNNKVVLGGDGKGNRLPATPAQLIPIPTAREKVIAPSKRIEWVPGEGKFHGIEPRDVADWERLAPAVNVQQEIASAARWLVDNPLQASQKRNFGAFLSNWMRNSQRRAEARGQVRPGPMSDRGPLMTGGTLNTRHNLESAREAAEQIRRATARKEPLDAR